MQYLHIPAIHTHSDIPAHIFQVGSKILKEYRHILAHTYIYLQIPNCPQNTCTYMQCLHIPALHTQSDIPAHTVNSKILGYRHIPPYTYRYLQIPTSPPIPAHTCNTYTYLHWIHTVTYLLIPSGNKIPTGYRHISLHTYSYLQIPTPPKYLHIHAIPAHIYMSHTYEYPCWHLIIYVQVSAGIL